MAGDQEQFVDWLEIEPEDEDELASTVCSIADGLEDEQEARRQRMLAHVRRYENRGLLALDAASYVAEDTTDGESVWKSATVNLARTQVDSVYADIASRYKPAPRIMTTGADWDTQVRAMRWNKFLVGQMRIRQGRYADAWEVMDRGAFRDCEITGEGYVKVYPDFTREQIAVERIYPWQLYCDQAEAEYGEPRTLVHVYPCDRARLKALFCDGDGDDDDGSDDGDMAVRRRKLDMAPRVEDTGASMRRLSDAVKIREIWTLAQSVDEPGRHAIVTDGVVLLDEEYPYLEHEIVALRWSDDVIGWGGQGLVHECSGLADAANHVLGRVMESYTLRSGRIVYVPVGSGVKKEDLEGNESVTIVPYTGDRPPTNNITPPLNPGELEFFQSIYGLAFNDTGVSQASAQGQTTLGRGASGRAQRAEKEFGVARMMPKGNMRDAAYQRLFRLMIRAGQQIAKEKPDFASTWPGRDFLRSYKWKDSAIDDESLYEVQVESEPRHARWTVAGRTATFDEGLAAGLVSPDTYRRVTEGTLDSDRENEALNEEYGAVMDDIEYLLETDPTDPEFFPRLPDGFLMDKPTAMSVAIGEYFRARRKGAPESRLRSVRNYIQGIDTQIQRVMAAQQQAQQPQTSGGAPGGSPPASPPPGAPPGNPPGIG